MSTHCVTMMKNFNLSLKIKEEEAISMEKQGIVSILDNVDSCSSSSPDGEEDHHEQLIKNQPIKTFDIWNSILFPKNEEDSSNKLIPTCPYVHPLVKRSTSFLSKKSLEICTESLGSETGSGFVSNCFFSSPTSEHEDPDNDKINHHHHNHHHHHHQQQQQKQCSITPEDFRVYNYSKRLMSSCKSFPPSLPSVQMQSRRQNGRLILEAVSIQPKNSLHAQRLDGHLLLTFTNQNDSELEMENRDDEVEVFEQVFDDIQEVEGNETSCSDSDDNEKEEEEEEDEEEEKEGIMMEQNPRLSSEQLSEFDDGRGEDIGNVTECYTYSLSISQSLPPPPDMAEVIQASPPPPPSSSKLV
ncbi:hypothetical protein HAX54_021170 [Datura stramonium]|uniref:FAF domain-containing protein n=1 Tax=Datura stramonium TaxID=4076 RepID=A0ABS8UU98_DATST|nr:hypothetical protein [Datura stramonium]